jgi:hypothetical protein
MYHVLQMQDPPKFNQTGNFGLKIYHLATLLGCLVVFKQDDFLLNGGRGGANLQNLRLRYCLNLLKPILTHRSNQHVFTLRTLTMCHSRSFPERALHQGCQIFLILCTKRAEIYQKDQRIYQICSCQKEKTKWP